MGEELLLTDEQGKWFLEMESTAGGDAVKMVEATTMDLEHYINLLIKQCLRGLAPILSLWFKYYQIALRATEELSMKGRVHQ